jgi:hypothetical protein
MDKVFRELKVFIWFAYLAVWIGFGVLLLLDLRSASASVTPIEVVFLVQLSLVVWFLSLIFLYLMRILVFYFFKKMDPGSTKGEP